MAGYYACTRCEGRAGDLATYCGGQRAVDTICPGDFRIQTEEFQVRGFNTSWPQLAVPGTTAAATAGSAHASGMRGIAAVPASVSDDDYLLCLGQVYSHCLIPWAPKPHQQLPSLTSLKVRHSVWQLCSQQGNIVGRRVSDRMSPGIVPDTNAAGCRNHRNDASRISQALLPNEVAVLVEAWFVPSAYPPVCCDDFSDWWQSFAGTDIFGEFPCQEWIYAAPLPQNDLFNTVDYTANAAGALAYAQRRPLNRSLDATCNPPFGFVAGQIGPYLSGRASSSRPGLPEISSGSRPFLRRPHQSVAVFIANVSASGMLQWPLVPASTLARPATRSDDSMPTALLFPDGQQHLAAGAAVDTFSMAFVFWDGDAGFPTCRITADVPGQCSPRPPWIEYDPLGDDAYPASALTCMGGHNTTCDLQARACGGVGQVIELDAFNAKIRKCAMSQLLGSQVYTNPPSLLEPEWQTGYTSLMAWWKPCQACGPIAAVREADASARPASCDLSACRHNISLALQSRVVRPGYAPSPALLAELVEADGGAFEWYACEASPLEGYFSGYPQCSPLCLGQPDLLAWQWPGNETRSPGGSVGNQSAAALWQGGSASRQWLMHWIGRRSGSAGLSTRGSAACVPVAEVAEALVLSGRVAVVGCPGGGSSCGAAASSGGDSGGGEDDDPAGEDDEEEAKEGWGRTAAEASRLRAPEAALRAGGGGGGPRPALLHPMLAGATLRLSLRVPLAQLQLVQRSLFLAELQADLSSLAGPASLSCLVLRCEVCPAADDGQVWSAAQTQDPPPNPGRASEMLELVVRVALPPKGQGACSVQGAAAGALSSATWLVDAREAAAAAAAAAGHGGGGGLVGRAAMPVAFTGAGSNESWLRGGGGGGTHAAALRDTPALDTALLPHASALILASSIVAGVRDAASHRAAGAWLVWAVADEQPADHESGAAVTVTPLCLTRVAGVSSQQSAEAEDALTGMGDRWNGSGECSELVSMTGAVLVPCLLLLLWSLPVLLTMDVAGAARSRSAAGPRCRCQLGVCWCGHPPMRRDTAALSRAASELERALCRARLRLLSGSATASLIVAVAWVAVTESQVSRAWAALAVAALGALAAPVAAKLLLSIHAAVGGSRPPCGCCGRIADSCPLCLVRSDALAPSAKSAFGRRGGDIAAAAAQVRPLLSRSRDPLGNHSLWATGRPSPEQGGSVNGAAGVGATLPAELGDAFESDAAAEMARSQRGSSAFAQLSSTGAVAVLVCAAGDSVAAANAAVDLCDAQRLAQRHSMLSAIPRLPCLEAAGVAATGGGGLRMQWQTPGALSRPEAAPESPGAAPVVHVGLPAGEGRDGEGASESASTAEDAVEVAVAVELSGMQSTCRTTGSLAQSDYGPDPPTAGELGAGRSVGPAGIAHGGDCAPSQDRLAPVDRPAAGGASLELSGAVPPAGFVAQRRAQRLPPWAEFAAAAEGPMPRTSPTDGHAGAGASEAVLRVSLGGVDDGSSVGAPGTASRLASTRGGGGGSAWSFTSDAAQRIQGLRAGAEPAVASRGMAATPAALPANRPRYLDMIGVPEGVGDPRGQAGLQEELRRMPHAEQTPGSPLPSESSAGSLEEGSEADEAEAEAGGSPKGCWGKCTARPVQTALFVLQAVWHLLMAAPGAAMLACIVAPAGSGDDFLGMGRQVALDMLRPEEASISEEALQRTALAAAAWVQSGLGGLAAVPAAASIVAAAVAAASSILRIIYAC